MRYLLLLAMTLLLSACGAREEMNVSDVHAQHAGMAPAAAAPMDGMSLYQLESAWTDQDGATRTLASLKGKPQVIAMVYTNCGSACPRIVGDMKRLEAQFPELGMVLVSIDPERDTPGRLKEFATGSALGSRWTLLSGSDDAIMELAAVLGVRYRRVSDKDFMHSTIITVLDGDGNMVHRQDVLGELEGTREALKGL